ncbi:MAG TPA: hypothetical protein VNJ01_05210 [Bacteriovoracaceae bacterium]|nr:hypothetical protein [Bacteriovoracaceae bacterium]
MKKHGDGHARHGLKVTWSGSFSQLVIEFQVNKRTSAPWLSDPAFTTDWSKNWGLWNKDVVEIFLQLRSGPSDLKAPYLELQVSALNQPFALVITEPRKTFHAPMELNLATSVTVEPRAWTAQFKFALPAELKGSLLYGGFFACLDQDPREFYALAPNSEENPDFHRPDLFLPLEL